MANSKQPHNRRSNETEEQRQKRLAYHREWMRKFRERHPERTREVNRRYAEKNAEKIRDRGKRRYQKDREKIIADVCRYAKANRKKINAANRARVAANPQRAREMQRAAYLRYREKDKVRRAGKREQLAAYMRHKRNSDPAFAIADRLRRRINGAISSLGAEKSGRLVDVSGCSIADLVRHIERQFLPGMSWENKRQWHIDHIIPCSAFNLTDPAEQRVAFHYTNLRPIWSSDNQRKHAKIPGGQKKFFWSQEDIERAKKRLA